MCKAHVLRFRCSHGILMALQPCRTGPCPMLKMTGQGLPPQPYRCYNCQHKSEQTAARSMPPRQNSNSSANSSTDSLSSNATTSSSATSVSSSPPTVKSPQFAVSHPLPGVAVQPAGCVRVARCKPQSYTKPFAFSCKSSDHYPTPHYLELPTYLPHQDHPCPPCQLEDLRVQADLDTMRCARIEYPTLKEDMLVHDGRTWDPEIMTKPTMEQYVEERRTDERQMWLHVTRKWTQDLKRARVLVAEEDGLGLFG